MDLIIDKYFNLEKNLWEISLNGDLDINSSRKLKNKLDKILKDTKADVVIDAEKLTYIDSTGLGILIGLLKKIKKNNNDLIIENPQNNVLKIFKITGLFKVIKIYKEGELING